MKKLKIAFIGNFQVYFTTEQDRAWSLRKLGHEVIELQENLTKAEDILSLIGKVDLLLYSHTHEESWKIPGLIEVFKKFKEAHIPTISIHLDRFAWLKRVEDVGKEATWFTEHQFMADASPEAVELYEKFNLNWHYLKPGVVERDCYIDNNYADFKYDVVFIGSQGYHPEYPFRWDLVEFLGKTYGDSFGHYGNDGLGVARGESLNRLCAVSRIVVGDSCFGGRPNYVSDRYYEIRGRGGFLMHPKVEGVDHDGVGFYKAEDLGDLKEKIDFYLKNPDVREEMRLVGFNKVIQSETYTDRMQEMLKVIYD